MKKITTTFKGGKVTIATEGFTGTACQLATAGYERVLGVTTGDAPTQEAYLPNTANTLKAQ